MGHEGQFFFWLKVGVWGNEVVICVGAAIWKKNRDTIAVLGVAAEGKIFVHYAWNCR